MRGVATSIRMLVASYSVVIGDRRPGSVPELDNTNRGVDEPVDAQLTGSRVEARWAAATTHRIFKLGQRNHSVCRQSWKEDSDSRVLVGAAGSRHRLGDRGADPTRCTSPAFPEASGGRSPNASGGDGDEQAPIPPSSSHWRRVMPEG